MKSFTRIKENLENKLNIENDYEDLKLALIEILDSSINTDSDELKIETMENYVKDDSTTIIGLINDSDVFDFYIKHKNQIDKVLTEADHFDISPSELAVNTSVYEYVVKSTKTAVQETFKKMLNK